MNNAIKIKDNIYWIGVNDRRTHIFENYWPLPKGVAYNSYVIVDEKVVVIDTVERSQLSGEILIFVPFCVVIYLLQHYNIRIVFPDRAF